MTYSSTLTSSPNLPYNLHCRPASADSAPYHGLQPTSKHLPSGEFSPPSSTTANTEGFNPSDTDSDGTRSTLRSLRELSMEEEGRKGDDKGKGKGKAVSRNASPSTSSSQGDMADNEMDVVPSQTSEQTEAPPPTKKKRTRTLTTPHQAAVLHALLAQSRFPTTAMREEVGRAIGLSARKVQIWFQNQRQKARRPKGQNLPPLTRPPQYGPFPSSASGSSHREIDDASLAESSQTVQLRGAPFSSPSSAGLDLAWREIHSSEGYRRTTTLAPQLSGPGIPGIATGPSSPESLRSVSRTEATRPQTSHPTVVHRRHTVTRPWTSERPERYYSTTQASSTSHRHSDDFMVQLPPLRLARPRSRTFAEHGAPYVASTPAPVGSPTSPARLPPLQPDSPFAYAPPLRFPPPFTLQPRPLWDDPSFSPFSRPSPYTGSHHIMAPHETIPLRPPSPAPQSSLVLAPARFSPSPRSPDRRTFRAASPLSLPDSYLPRRARGPDHDAPSHDHDAPR